MSLETETTKAEKLNVKDATVRPSWLIFRFVFGWIFSILILAVIALMVNIDWAKPKVEEVMTQTLHRPVRLGHMRWFFGFNGLTITTRFVDVKEEDGDPFMKAGGTNIGIAFTPLLSGKVVVKHLKFDHPEFWFVKLKPGGWNFEDLLVDTTEVHFIQVDDGVVHIVDATKEAIVKKPFDVTDLDMKFNWPVTGRKLPFFLSMAMPSSNKDKSEDFLRLDGFTTGVDKDLKKTELEMTVSAGDMHTDDLRKVLSIVADRKEQKELFAGNTFLKAPPVKAQSVTAPIKVEVPGKKTSSKASSVKVPLPAKKNDLADVSGLLSFKNTLKGSIEKGFTAELSTKVKSLAIAQSQIGKVKTGEINTEGELSLTDKEISWSDLNFSVGGVSLSSKGDLKNWQEKSSQYDFDVESNIKDLSALTKAIDFSSIKQDKDGKLLKVIKTATASGKAFFKINVTGESDQAKLLTKLDIEGLPIAKVIKEVAPEALPLLAIVGITEESRLKGHFESHPGRKLSIKQGAILIPDSIIKLDGELDLLRDSMDVKFDLSEVNLKKVWDKALASPETRKLIEKEITGTNPKNLLVSGFVRAQGNIKRNKKGLDVVLTASLREGGLVMPDKTLVANNVVGKVELKNGTLRLNSVEGKVGNTGRFSLTGQVNKILSPTPQVDMIFYGNNIEFNNLGKVMNLVGLSFPAITEGHLTGRVKELSIKLLGPPKNPNVFLSASPEDIAYRPPGLSRSLRAVSGTILFANDVITLSDVDIVARGMKLTTSLVIEDLSGSARLKNVHVKSDGIDIGDIDYYLASTVMPPPLRQQYKDFLNTYKIRNLHGRIYGDLVVEPRPAQDINIEGVIGCYSVGALVGQKGELELPLERIAGIIAASGDELLIQDLSGNARSTEFQLNGSISNYKSKKPSWKTELRSTISASEFLDLIPKMTEGFAGGKLKVQSQGPLILKAKIEGDMEKNKVIFSSHSDAKNNFQIITPAITINQPQGEEMNLDGSISTDTKGLTLHNTNLLVGEAALTAQGQFNWTPGQETINITILSPNPVPAKIIVGLVNPSMDTKNMMGSLDGFVALEGPVAHPKLTGKISMDRVSNKDYQLFDLNGSISTDNTSAKDPYSVSLAKIDIDRLRYHKLNINDVGGMIEVQMQEQKDKSQAPMPKLLLRDITARLAGGLAKVDGYYDMDTSAIGVNAYLSKIHMEEVVDRVFDSPDEMTGALDGEIHLTTRGVDDKEILKNMEGTGQILIEKGIVSRFGQLQNKLTQANFLFQGILGFNLNNLLQSVAPVRSGEFNELTSSFQVYKGALAIKELRFSGDDLRLWGAGTVNLMDSSNIDLDIAGTLPRVSESFLSGSLGKLSRNITVSGLLSKVTFGRLENLPSLPIIGDIASDKPRAFAFKVQAPAQDAKQISKSIEKTFKFLPNRQAASAHPVPGL